MTHTKYKAVLKKAFNQYAMALRRTHELEIEMDKLKQFIHATMNMLPDEDRAYFLARLDQLAADEDIRSVGLKRAITKLMSAQPREWFTATKMRDRLLASGFDFRNYMTNPLASVSTTLKRMKSVEAEHTAIEGVAAYRWKIKSSRVASNKPEEAD
jgi:hypothetical protein